MTALLRHCITTTLLLGCRAAGLRAQGNYEVQVYASGLVPKGATMLEFHTNFTASGTKKVGKGGGGQSGLRQHTRKNGTHNRHFTSATESLGTLSRVFTEMQTYPDLIGPYRLPFC